MPAEGEVVSGDVEGEGAINGTSSQEVEPYENQPSNNESEYISTLSVTFITFTTLHFSSLQAI